MKLFTTTGAVLLVAGLTVLQSSTVHAKNNMALTWKTHTAPELTGAAGNISGQRIVVVGCASSCNSYTGDTSTTKKRRILCIVPGNLPAPAVYTNHYSTIGTNNVAVNNWKFYYNWSGAKIGLTEKIKGSNIINQAKADQICKSKKRGLNDKRARMLEHHDNKVGGWNVGGFLHPNSKAKHLLKNPKKKQRYWVRIRNQPANPWSP